MSTEKGEYRLRGEASAREKLLLRSSPPTKSQTNACKPANKPLLTGVQLVQELPTISLGQITQGVDGDNMTDGVAILIEGNLPSHTLIRNRGALYRIDNSLAEGVRRSAI